jgi:regulator of replication initiation timing
MATEGHEHGQREGHKKKWNPKMDMELNEIRERMEQLTLKIKQDAKAHWVYECPMRKKLKWPVKRLLARGQQQLLKKWFRRVENLSDIEEDMIHICELEFGRHLSDEEEVRSDKDLINCQESRDGFSYS